MADTTSSSTINKTVISTYQYKLLLGANIKDPDISQVVMSLTATKGLSLYIGDTQTTVTLQGVKFTRKIYEPGTIEAEIAVSPVLSVEEANELFLMRYAELYIKDTGSTTVGDKEMVIARNYFVYMVNPQIVMNNSKSSMYVKLTIHSMDKLMALNKYSQVFTSRKLGDILNYESKTFGFKKVMFQTDNGCLRHLRYPIGDSGKDLTDDSISQETSLEFIQPYLVQYNETFYDFMVRTANRCGEFMLFEDGTLYLGLPMTEATDIQSIPSYASITFQDFSSTPLDIPTYARDSVKDGQGDLDFFDRNTGAIKKDSAGFPKDAFPDAPVYNSEVALDEYTFPLYHFKWSNLHHEIGFDNPADIPIATIFSLMKAEMQNVKTHGFANFIDFAGRFFGEVASLLYSGSYDTVVNNFSKTWEFIRPLKDNSEQYKDRNCVYFGTIDKDGWATVHYYSDVRKYQEQQQKKIICIDMGVNYVDVKLGETIKVEGLKDNYVVTEIRLVSNQTWTRDYRKVNPADRSTDIYSDKQSQIIYAIPTYKDKNDKERVMPPVAPVSIIRKAGPQTAFVVDNKDPKRQGRVRIAYPWQSTASAKRLELMAAEESVRLATNAVKAAYDEIQKLTDLLAKLTSVKTALESTATLSDDDKKKKIDELDKEIATLDKQIKALTLAVPSTTDNNNSEDKKDEEDNNDDKKDEENNNDDKKDEEDNNDDEKNEDSSASTTSIDTTTPVSTLEKALQLAQQEKLRRLQLKKEVLETIKKKLNNETADIDAEITKLETEIAKTKTYLTKAEYAKKTAEEKQKEKELEVNKQAKEWTGDLKQMASPWVRVATPMATTGGGTYFKPQVGDEVLVNYDNGNIERPYVVGSLFSKNVPDPADFLNCTAVKSDLLKDATTTIMSPNGHHIVFNDPTEGSAFISGIQAGVGTLVKYGINTPTGLDWGKDCTGGIHIGDRYGLYELSMSSHNRKITISSSMGDVSIDAFSGITLSAPNGNVKIVGKNVSIEAGNNIEITSGNNIQYPVEGHPTILGKSGNFVKSIAKSLVGSITGYAAQYVDLTFARTCTEVLLRPIEGTNCIKSKRYLMLEAGKGKAHIPQDRYAKDEEDVFEQQDFFDSLMDGVEAINTRFEDFAKRYKKAWSDAYEKMDVWLKIQVLLQEGHENDIDPKAEGWLHGTEQEWAPVFEAEDFANIVKPTSFKIKGTDRDFVEIKKRLLAATANAYAHAVYDVKHCREEFSKLFDKDHNIFTKSPGKDHMDTILDNTFHDAKKDRLDNWDNTYGSDEPNDTFLATKEVSIKDDPLFSNLKGFKRYLAALFIANVATDEYFAMPKTSFLEKAKTFFTDPLALTGGKGKYLKIHYDPAKLTEERLAMPYYWQQFVGNMRLYDHWALRAAFDAVVTPFQAALQLTQDQQTNHSDKVYKTTWQQIHDRNVWNDRANGLILLSDAKDMTRAFVNGKWQESTKENRGNWEYLSEYLLRYMN